ncbi:MAG: globin family protein [Microcoleaceae cyanobacterium]
MSLKIETLEQSFEKVKPYANEFVNGFYDNLFTQSPETKLLFAYTNMAKQKTMLLSSLVFVVENLRHPNALSETLKGLGARHAKYGVLPEYYPLVGNALLTTFEQFLKADWTPETKEAWVEAYGDITKIMLVGADYSEEVVKLEGASTNLNISGKQMVSIADESPDNLVDWPLFGGVFTGAGILLILLLLL